MLKNTQFHSVEKVKNYPVSKSKSASVPTFNHFFFGLPLVFFKSISNAQINAQTEQTPVTTYSIIPQLHWRCGGGNDTTSTLSDNEQR